MFRSNASIASSISPLMLGLVSIGMVGRDCERVTGTLKTQAITASIAQLGERQTEDLKALCSIHSRGT